MKHLKYFESNSEIHRELIEEIKDNLLNFEDIGCSVHITDHDESAAKYVMKPGGKVYTVSISKNFKIKESGDYKQDINEIIDFKEEELTFIERLKDLNIDFIYKENGHLSNDYYHVSKEFIIGDYIRYDKNTSREDDFNEDDMYF
jgi:hypothetical protein